MSDGVISDETNASSINSLWDTSWWWNDGREDPVIDGWVSDPEAEDGNWEAPADDVSDSVSGCFSCQFPEGW